MVHRNFSSLIQESTTRFILQFSIILNVENFPGHLKISKPNLKRLKNKFLPLTSNKRIPRLLTCVRKVKHSKSEVIAVNDSKSRLDVASKY